MDVTVLLVEDDDEQAVLVKAQMARHGLSQVTQVRRLSDAIDAVETKKFDAALVDLGLDDSAGLETFRVLRGRAPELPIVVYTGNIKPRMAVDAVRAGADEFLRKGPDMSGAPRAIMFAVARRAPWTEAADKLIDRLHHLIYE